MKRFKKVLWIGLLSMVLAVGSGSACMATQRDIVSMDEEIAAIPWFTGSPYIELNENTPEFTDEELGLGSFEEYAELDDLGRCGTAFALVGEETMPTEERGEIGKVKPSGWHTAKYDCVDGKYLYNRCHLLGYQLTAENANEKNLITGTRYMNVDGMLPFENMVADYVKETGNHVLYRVTPMFAGSDLVARGVKMEAQSVEDAGDGVMFNVFCYNVQPGVLVDYATGESRLDELGTVAAEPAASENNAKADYILNTNSKKFHLPACSSAKKTSEKNKEEFTGTRDELIAQGYEPCKNCNP